MAHRSGNPAWQNAPATATPLSSTALEALESGIDAEYTRALAAEMANTAAIAAITPASLGAATPATVTTAVTAAKLVVSAVNTSVSGTLLVGTLQLLNPAAAASWALPATANDGDRVGVKNLAGSPGPGVVGVVVTITGNINGNPGASLPERYADQTKTFTWSAAQSSWIVTAGDLSVPSLPFDAFGAATAAAAAVTPASLGVPTNAALTAALAAKQATTTEAGLWSPSYNSGAGYGVGAGSKFGGYRYQSLVPANLATPTLGVSDASWYCIGPDAALSPSSARETVAYNSNGTVATVTETDTGAVISYTYNADLTPATETRTVGTQTIIRTFAYSSGNLTGVS